MSVVSAVLPVTQSPDNPALLVQAMPICNPDGTTISGGGGGGGGAVTVADGADVAQGAIANAAYTDTTGAASGTLVGIIKGLFKLVAARLPTALAANGGLKIEGVASGVQVPTVASATDALLTLLTNAVNYETVAASQTAQAMGATGATGDYISHIIIQPGSVSPGAVTLLDNATTIYTFPGGVSSVTSVDPIIIPLGVLSVSGAWKITTGAGVTAVGVGKFT